MPGMVRTDLSTLPAYVPGKALPDALRLASNETAAAPLPAVQEAVAKAAAGLNRYPDMGVAALRGELAEWLSRTPGAPDLTAENIAVGNGSSALCLQAIQATCQDGDEVVFPWRSFEAYPILAQIAGARPVAVPLSNDYRIDLDAMLAAVTERTRLIFVCNPNNPTGTVVPQARLTEFLKQVPEDVQVVLDEAYIEYDRSGLAGDTGEGADVPGEGFAASVNGLALMAQFPNVAVCRTFSKAYGLAGVRLGYLAGSAEFVEALLKVAIPFGVNALAQVAGLESIGEEAQQQLQQRVTETINQRERVTESLPAELQVPSQANFVWLPVGDKAEALEAAMKEEGILTRCFAGEGVRITVTDETETEELIPALRRALAQL
ncbi:histidinol-phosphate transaminase [Corynebacterium sp. UMB4614]|uniref:histidinol-phosphate transaminase n=1 Tax=Corynebacterium sp. UMB4614 TaxID=3046334 RepID=UPI002551B481|nr:histidinol-phosphate transaminase [Corynebacterium sp. UMB4614]MDK7135689.1 histidinol-phosphate transaminase [Corynebacterium sp. UMB4614]